MTYTEFALLLNASSQLVRSVAKLVSVLRRPP